MATSLPIGTLLTLEEMLGSPVNAAMASMETLKEYQENRFFDIKQRVAGVSALNQISKSSNKVIQNIRAFGIDNFFQVPAIKHTAMKLGIGNR